MRVIFLDIDGVLTTYSYHNPDTNNINPDKVQILSQIVKRTGAKIVLTSTWKMGYDKDSGKKEDYYKVLENILAQYGLEIFDITDDIPEKIKNPLPQNFPWKIWIRLREYMEPDGQQKWRNGFGIIL